MRKTRVTIPFATCPATLPIVSLYLANGEVWHAAIDSGSECTVFNAEFVRKNAGDFTADNQEVKTTLIGVASETVVNVEKKLASVTIKDKDGAEVRMKMKGVSVDLSKLCDRFSESYGKQYNLQAIIGSDVMRDFKAIIDLGRMSIRIMVPVDIPAKTA